MDGQLFAIKQLLVLREQIAPFEADFAVGSGGTGWSLVGCLWYSWEAAAGCALELAGALLGGQKGQPACAPPSCCRSMLARAASPSRWPMPLCLPLRWWSGGSTSLTCGTTCGGPSRVRAAAHACAFAALSHSARLPLGFSMVPPLSCQTWLQLQCWPPCVKNFRHSAVHHPPTRAPIHPCTHLPLLPGWPAGWCAQASCRCSRYLPTTLWSRWWHEGRPVCARAPSTPRRSVGCSPSCASSHLHRARSQQCMRANVRTGTALPRPRPAAASPGNHLFPWA